MAGPPDAEKDNLRLESLESSEEVESARGTVAEHQQAAFEEERSGCFGAAEVHWKAAFDLAQRFFPDTSLHASIAIETGSFLYRFLRKSEVPLKYLRFGESRSHLLEAEYAKKAKVILVKCLIESENCREAEALIDTLDPRDAEIDGRVGCFYGLIALTRKDLMKSESLLREAVVKCRCLRSEVYGESLTALGEVLLEKEQYEECESVALEAIAALQGSGSLLPALRLFTRLCDETNQFQKLDSTVESLTIQLRGSSGYLLSEVMVAWGDAYASSSCTHAALHYLQSLRLCQEVEGRSWYVARVLQRLVRLRSKDPRKSQFVWNTFVKNTATKKLQELLPNLPTVSSMLSVDMPVPTKLSRAGYAQTFLKKVKWLLANGDDVESGEIALIAQHFSQDFLFEEYDPRRFYLSRFPTSKCAARLLARGNAAECAEAISIYRRVDVTHAELICAMKHSDEAPLQKWMKLVEESKAVAVVSNLSFDSLIHLSAEYKHIQSTKELEVLTQALKVAEEMNPHSSRSLKAKLLLGVKLPSDDLLRDAVRIASLRRPLTDTFRRLLVKSAMAGDLPDVQEAIQRCEVLTRTAFVDLIFAEPMDFAYFEKCAVDSSHLRKSPKVLKRMVLYAQTHRDLGQDVVSQLQSKLREFHGVRPFFWSSFFPAHIFLLELSEYYKIFNLEERLEILSIKGMRELKLSKHATSKDDRLKELRRKYCC